jgi:hypothetical protein
MSCGGESGAGDPYYEMSGYSYLVYSIGLKYFKGDYL